MGPIGAARVGYINGEYVLNPTLDQLNEDNRMDLIVAGTADAVMMVESEIKELSEEIVLGGVLYSIGAIIYTARHPDPSPAVFGYHEIFHVLVVAAAVCHFAVVVGVVRALR